jgi:hypothetical protein
MLWAMRVLAFASLLLSSVFGEPITTLRMRGDGFDGRRAGAPNLSMSFELEHPLVQAKAAPAPRPGGSPVVALITRFVDLEAGLSSQSRRVEPGLRVDFGQILNALPKIPGKRRFLLDVAIVDAGIAAGMLVGYGAGKALDFPYWQGGWQRFYGYASEHGPIGVGAIEFKDGNYGDPWVNNFSHPVGFEFAAAYFRKRGYSPGLAFLGGMAINASWEFMFEAYEIPKSGHDLFFMNLLGALAGSRPDFGIAWGAAPFRFLDATGHYTEFYYRPRGGVWRYFVRSEPNGDYRYGPDGRKLERDQKPLFVNDYSFGVAREDWGVTAYVTGVTDPKPRGFKDVHGPSDVFDGAAAGVSFDLLKLLPALR